MLRVTTRDASSSVSNAMMDKILDLIVEDDIELNGFVQNNQSAQYEAGSSIVIENAVVQNNSILNLRAGESVTMQSNVTIGTNCEVTVSAKPYCE